MGVDRDMRRRGKKRTKKKRGKEGNGALWISPYMLRADESGQAYLCPIIKAHDRVRDSHKAGYRAQEG